LFSKVLPAPNPPFFNRRSSPGEKPVVPLGLVLSVIAVYIMLFTGWKGEEWYSARPYRYDEVQR
jgi:uncharacterized membrane protein